MNAEHEMASADGLGGDPPTADELRAKLEAAGQKRQHAHWKLRDATDELAHLLARAIDHPELTMTEAVKAAGIGRTFGYKLVRERGT